MGHYVNGIPNGSCSVFKYKKPVSKSGWFFGEDVMRICFQSTHQIQLLVKIPTTEAG